LWLLLVESEMFQGLDLVGWVGAAVDPDGFDVGVAEELGDGHEVGDFDGAVLAALASMAFLLGGGSRAVGWPRRLPAG
jgi:hypothetical protein